MFDGYLTSNLRFNISLSLCQKSPLDVFIFAGSESFTFMKSLSDTVSLISIQFASFVSSSIYLILSL
nr:MAG TPA: hypothetical protein [Caudoviricetes sp.]